MKNNLTIHMIVKNEQQWVWYAIKSVIDCVNKIIIYDTGSRDRTVDIIHTFPLSKIDLTLKGEVDAKELVRLRNDQIRKTTTPWFLLLDGDEVWPTKSIQNLMTTINRQEHHIAIAVKSLIPVGDLFHYQPEIAGEYNLLGEIGHFNVRAYKIQKDYSWIGQYPLEAYTDKNGIPVQNKSGKLILLNCIYWHMTHLIRSSIDTHNKRKLEIGEFRSLLFPEVFFETRPRSVPSPWITYTLSERLAARLLTPILYLKRKIMRKRGVFSNAK